MSRSSEAWGATARAARPPPTSSASLRITSRTRSSAASKDWPVASVAISLDYRHARGGHDPRDPAHLRSDRRPGDSSRDAGDPAATSASGARAEDAGGQDRDRGGGRGPVRGLGRRPGGGDPEADVAFRRFWYRHDFGSEKH